MKKRNVYHNVPHFFTRTQFLMNNKTPFTFNLMREENPTVNIQLQLLSFLPNSNSIRFKTIYKNKENASGVGTRLEIDPEA